MALRNGDLRRVSSRFRALQVHLGLLLGYAEWCGESSRKITARGPPQFVLRYLGVRTQLLYPRKPHFLQGFPPQGPSLVRGGCKTDVCSHNSVISQGGHA